MIIFCSVAARSTYTNTGDALGRTVKHVLLLAIGPTAIARSNIAVIASFLWAVEHPVSADLAAREGQRKEQQQKAVQFLHFHHFIMCQIKEYALKPDQPSAAPLEKCISGARFLREALCILLFSSGTQSTRSFPEFQIYRASPNLFAF